MAKMELASTSHQVFCSLCQQLAITRANRFETGDIPIGGTPLLSLGKLYCRITCDLCRYFINLAPRYRRNYKLYVRLFNRFDVSTYDSRYVLVGGLMHVWTPFLSVVRENVGIYYDSSVLEEVFKAGIIVYIPAEHDHLVSSTLHPIDGITTVARRSGESMSWLSLVGCSRST